VAPDEVGVAAVLPVERVEVAPTVVTRSVTPASSARDRAGSVAERSTTTTW